MPLWSRSPCPGAHSVDQFFGPIDPVVSPDGSTIAYWDTVSLHTFDPNCNCNREELRNITTSTASDHFTSPGFVPREEQPHWLRDVNRVVVTDSGEGPQTGTWVPGTDQSGLQWWFQDPNYVLTNSTVSPDGTKFAAMGTDGGITHADDLLLLYNTTGPAFSGQPPYDNNAPGVQFPSAPSFQCHDHHWAGQLDHPTWAPDSSALAYEAPDGVYVETLPATLSGCDGVAAHLILPGAQQPNWGPADVDPSQAPVNQGSPGGGAPAPGAGGSRPGPRPGAGAGVGQVATAAISGLRVKLSRKRVPSFTFTLSAPARVTVILQRVVKGHRAGRRCSAGKRRGKPCTTLRPAGTLTFAGRTGANTVAGVKLPPGRYLALTTTPSRQQAGFTVR